MRRRGEQALSLFLFKASEIMQCCVTDFDIQALIDNELGWEEEKRIHAYLSDNPTARKYYEEMVEQKDRLKKWWRGMEH